MLDESAPRWREAWTSITTTASSSVNAWLGREQGPGIILDGGLRPELKIANPVIKIEKQVNLSRLQCQAKHEHPFKRWGEALKSSSPPPDSPLIYSLPDDMRLVHPKESVYPRLESISLPVRGSSIALMLKHSESPGSSVEKLITNMNPGLKRVTFLGAGGNEGVGWSIGSFLRPEKISFSNLPCTIEEVVYVNAEMPRVHHSCSHLKPWEAVLLCSTSLYCLTHFVRPALRHNQCSSIKKVTCVDLRIPSGLFIEECISPILMVNEEEDGEGGEPLVEKSLWSISVSNRSFLLTAPDGLDVEVVTVTMTRIE